MAKPQWRRPSSKDDLALDCDWFTQTQHPAESFERIWHITSYGGKFYGLFVGTHCLHNACTSLKEAKAKIEKVVEVLGHEFVRRKR